MSLEIGYFLYLYNISRMDLKVFVHNDIIKNKNLEFMNMGNVDKIYRLPRYNGGPNGGHWHDVKNRQYITFEEACNI